MHWPADISTTLAKKKAKKQKLQIELVKLEKEIEELEAKEISK